MVTRPGFPYLFAVLNLWFTLWFAEGTAPVLVPLPTQGCDRCAPSYAPTGEPTLSGAPLSPCFAAESTREGTLMSLPEGIATPLRLGLARRVEGRCRPKVTSGCPKRSEGGCPCRNEDEYRFPCRAERRNEPSGLPPAKTCPSRPAHPEEHAGRRHHSSPRRARVRRLHAHRWRLRG